jgi:hypothetical protein
LPCPKIDLVVLEVLPTPYFLGQAIAKPHVIAVRPAALGTVFGVLFIDAGVKG